MQRKHKTTKRKTRRRGAGIREWASKPHNFIKSKSGYSKGLSYAHNRFTKPMIENKLGKSQAALVNQGIAMGWAKLRQGGYGL